MTARLALFAAVAYVLFVYGMGDSALWWWTILGLAYVLADRLVAVLCMSIPIRCPKCSGQAFGHRDPDEPLWYRCRACGHVVRTQVKLGSASFGSPDRD